MKLLAALAVVCLLSGCETPNKAYVSQHPELTPEHRKILLAGKIKFGDPVEGMTREQVRLVMGKDPDQFDSVNGEDAWIWLKSSVARENVTTGSDLGGPANAGTGGKHGEDSTEPAQTESKPSKVTVFFKGNIATRVQFGGL